MKNNKQMKHIFLIFLFVFFLFFGNKTSAQVEIWKRTDIVLTALQTYSNPYSDVEIDAVFIHEDGDRINLCGFWNGGNEWRVRFAPTKTGIWTYSISSRRIYSKIGIKRQSRIS
jgi:hypothetical protein